MMRNSSTDLLKYVVSALFGMGRTIWYKEIVGRIPDMAETTIYEFKSNSIH